MLIPLLKIFPDLFRFLFLSFFLFIFFASRPPVGGIDDGAGGFVQD
jgi:hypothetical protein